MLNLSNLAWFEDSIALPQHLQISRFRALESRRWLIRAANAGEKAVAKYGGIPPYAETKGYVKRVLALHKQYSAEPKEGRTAIVSMRPEVVSD